MATADSFLIYGFPELQSKPYIYGLYRLESQRSADSFTLPKVQLSLIL